MRICTALCFVPLEISSTCALSAQELFHPEELAGRWEASDGGSTLLPVHGAEVLV